MQPFSEKIPFLRSGTIPPRAVEHPWVKVAMRSRAITKKLRDVEELPANPQPLLPELLSEPEEEANEN